eukprot:tig00021070_g17938.t1
MGVFRGMRKENCVDSLGRSFDVNEQLKGAVAAASSSQSSFTVEAMTMRGVVIAANWKMNKTIGEALAYMDEFKRMNVVSPVTQVYLGVPATCLNAVANAARGTRIVVGAQNMSQNKEGAFTGEVTGPMIKDAGAQFVILGHSERRQFYGETNQIVNAKLKKALADGIQPIVCIGESLEQREAGVTFQVLDQQIRESFEGLSGEEMRSLIIAYEPIWAIGTGKTATPEVAQETHAACRQILAAVWGPAVAEDVVIQYGGSVTPDNVKSLMSQPDIDGALVGGASLKPDSFFAIANYSH